MKRSGTMGGGTSGECYKCGESGHWSNGKYINSFLSSKCQLVYSLSKWRSFWRGTWWEEVYQW
ncbi:hypothetical protein JB92DRAFT_3037518 [Gautieria morchelliformis]|nr:hypothetical protein JB92DRAFT_3037518 [Gautieria morchelliformis]